MLLDWQTSKSFLRGHARLAMLCTGFNLFLNLFVFVMCLIYFPYVVFKTYEQYMFVIEKIRSGMRPSLRYFKCVYLLQFFCKTSLTLCYSNLIAYVHFIYTHFFFYAKIYSNAQIYSNANFIL